MKRPELIIIGGANGSGKTTFAREIAAEFKIDYLGADDWFLIFNAGDSFEQIANGDANGGIIFDEERFRQWQTAIK